MQNSVVYNVFKIIVFLALMLGQGGFYFVFCVHARLSMIAALIARRSIISLILTPAVQIVGGL